MRVSVHDGAVSNMFIYSVQVTFTISNCLSQIVDEPNGGGFLDVLPCQSSVIVDRNRSVLKLIKSCYCKSEIHRAKIKQLFVLWKLIKTGHSLYFLLCNASYRLRSCKSLFIIINYTTTIYKIVFGINQDFVL